MVGAVIPLMVIFASVMTAFGKWNKPTPPICKGPASVVPGRVACPQSRRQLRNVHVGRPVGLPFAPPDCRTTPGPAQPPRCCQGPSRVDTAGCEATFCGPSCLPFIRGRQSYALRIGSPKVRSSPRPQMPSSPATGRGAATSGKLLSYFIQSTRGTWPVDGAPTDSPSTVAMPGDEEVIMATSPRRGALDTWLVTADEVLREQRSTRYHPPLWRRRVPLRTNVSPPCGR